MKFSNDGKMLLVSTLRGHIHVLDAFEGQGTAQRAPGTKQHSTVQCSVVQYSAVQCSTVQYSPAQYVQQLWVPLSTGATCVVCSSTRCRSPDADGTPLEASFSPDCKYIVAGGPRTPHSQPPLRPSFFSFFHIFLCCPCLPREREHVSHGEDAPWLQVHCIQYYTALCSTALYCALSNGICSSVPVQAVAMGVCGHGMQPAAHRSVHSTRTQYCIAISTV